MRRDWGVGEPQVWGAVTLCVAERRAAPQKPQCVCLQRCFCADGQELLNVVQELRTKPEIIPASC